MRFSSSSLLRCSTVASLVLSASAASAHIDLLSPTPRYVVNRSDGGGSKECPCGGAGVDPDRVCNTPAAQSHDPNRSANVTTFEAGSTITIKLEEYINHSGRFRVAFDQDGADLTDFNSQILMDVTDPNNAVPMDYTWQVTLPNVTCENCTLQVIQDMNGNTTTPVADPAPDPTYYTCADIRLVAQGSLGASDSSGGAGAAGAANSGAAGGTSVASGGAAGMTSMAASGGATAASTGGAGGSGSGGPAAAPTTPSTSVGAAGTGATTAGTAPAATATGTNNAANAAAPGSNGLGMSAVPPTAGESSDDSGGCSFEAPSGARSWALWGLAPAALIFARRLRRRSARS